MSKLLFLGSAIAQLLTNNPATLVVPGIGFMGAPAIVAQQTEQHWLEIGSKRYADKDYFGAIGAFTEGLKVRPTVMLLMSRSLAWTKIDNHDRAIADLNGAIAMEPNKGILHTMRGSVYMRLGDKARATRDLSRGIQLQPDGMAYLSRGIMFMNFGDFTAAREDLNIAAQKFKGDDYFYNQVMKLLASI